MDRVGAHVSISGGIQNAVERELDVGGNCGQIFVGSPRGWAVGEVDTDDAAAFTTGSEENDVGPWIVHGTYLINLATPKDDLAEKSVTAVQEEIDNAASLDIPYYTFHPGAHTGAGEETGLMNVADRLSQLDVPDGVRVLLENTAGKGTTVGRDLEDLETMLEAADYGPDDLGVCLDTCHLFAAGHDFRTPAAVDDLVDEIDATVGLGNVHYLHLNDSKHPFGSEKDEHEHIGEGEIGADAFEHLINHDALRDLPKVVETPESDGKDFEWNIARVRELLDGD